MKKYSNLTDKYISTNKKRAFITIGTIILSIAIMISFTMIYNAQEIKQKENVKSELGNYDVNFNDLDKEQYEKLKADNRVKSVYMGREEGALISKNINENFIDVYDFTRVTTESYENVFNNIVLMRGRLPEKNDEIIIDYEAANNMGLSINIGDELTFDLYPNAERVRDYYRSYRVKAGEDLIESTDKEKSINEKQEVKYKIVGITSNMAGQHKIFGFVSEDELYKDNNIDTFATLSDDKKHIWGDLGYGSEKYIADDLGLNFLMRSGTSGKGNIGSQVKYLDYSLLPEDSQGVVTGNSTIILVIVAIFMFATIYNIFNISVIERIRHIGILRAIGASRKQITNIVLKEANIYALIGIPIGVVIGYLFTKAVFVPITSFMNVTIPTSYLGIEIVEVIKVILIVYLMVIISANSGIKKQVKMTPVEAMNTFMSNNKNKVDSIGKNKFIEGNGKIEVKLAYKNLYRNITRNNMCTLVISASVILFIFFSSMFFNGLNNIDVSVPSKSWNVELSREDNPLTFKAISDDKKEEIKSIDGVNKIYTSTNMNLGMPIKKELVGELLENVYQSDKDWLNLNREYEDYYLSNVFVRVVDKNTLKLYEKYLVDGNIANDNYNDNGILIVNSGSKRYINLITDGGTNYQFSKSDNLLNVKAGDNIKIFKNNYPIDASQIDKNIKIDESQFANLRINGVLKEDALKDNYNKYDTKEITSDFKIIMTKECYEKNFGPILSQSVYLDVSNDSNRENVIEKIKSVTNDERYSVKDYEKIRSAEEENVNENMAIQLMFLVTLAIIVVINIANTFYASIIMRKKEFAAIRAIGMSMKQLKRMIIMEVGIIALESTIWAIVIGGFPTAWKEANLGKVGMANWNLWLASIIISIFVILILTFGSTINAIRKLNTISIVDDLREEE